MKLINYEDVQRKLGGDKGPSRRTIERMVERGEFVAPIRVSPRRVMFSEAEVDSWIAARKVGHDGGKRDPMDYDSGDIENSIARAHGYTLDQVMRLDFPVPDYSDAAGAQYWTFETVTAWLERFHTAIHAMEQAADPEGFERQLQTLCDLMNQKGT
jgi:predicted DNA-binding transcriptional regulator AlpA